MDFYKKILVLKCLDNFASSSKNLSGIVRVESEDGTTTLSLSLINFPFMETGNYEVAISFDNNPVSILDLGKKPNSLIKNFFSLSNFTNFSVGIFVNAPSPTLVAFARTENGITQEKLEQIYLSNASFSNVDNQYDDEAVATEDYFSIEQKIKDKVELIDRWDNESKQNDVVKIHSESQEDTSARDFGVYGSSNEKEPLESQDFTEQNPYYQSAKNELEQLFERFPVETSLSSILPNSRFCKINYAFDKYYVVGVVFDNNEAKYICYGVPSHYSKEPPKELKDYCSFLPLSIFDLEGDGFWMMFQDAVSGKCVKK